MRFPNKRGAVVRWACLSGALVGLINGTYGAVVTSASGSADAVQAAIDVAANGDTVQIPAGSYAWATQVVNRNKAINIVGAGVDSTVIVDGFSQTGAACLLIGNTGNKLLRLSGITFVGFGSGTVNGIVGVADARCFRVDHCKFSNLEQMGLVIWGDSWGVVDHCLFQGAGGGATGVSLRGDGSLWSSSATFGTTNAAYIEDCSFVYGSSFGNGAIDAYNGARFVFRNNVVTNSYVGWHGCDSGGYRATFSQEVYNSTFYSAISVPYFIQSRGGTGLYFSNTCAKVGDTVPILLQDFRATTAKCWPVGFGFAPWGFVTGANPYDGNKDTYGYASLDQCGWTGPTTFLIDHSLQVSSPVYAWSNTCNGFKMSIAVDPICTVTPSALDLIKAGRDYFDGAAKPGYSPLSYPHPLVLGGDTTVTNPVLSLSKTAVDFGPVTVGNKIDVALVVRNVGGDTLAGVATATGPFMVLGPAAYSLQRNQSQVITIRFAPANTNAINGLATFTGGGGGIVTLVGQPGSP